MGSYGIGVSRSLAAIVEQYHDENGIIWPLVVAPYHVIITVVNTKKEEQIKLGEKLYTELLEEGVEVLLDDRNGSAGVKFNDRDLIGIPIRITVGKRAEKYSRIFFKKRWRKNRNSQTEAMDKIKEEFEKKV